LLVVGGECLIGNYCEALTVNVPCQKQARTTAILVHPNVKWLTACNNVYLSRLHPSATLVNPITPLVAVDVNVATVIRCQPKLYGVMFWDCDEPCHVNHEQVACAVLIRLTVIASVDVVLNLRTTQLILSS
jgi:hypothetical protein